MPVPPIRRRQFLLTPGCLLPTGMAASHRASQATEDAREGPVRLVVPFPPGGTTDAVARHLADAIRIQTTMAVVVENRPGAGTLLAAASVGRSAPGAKTLMVASSSTFGTALELARTPPEGSQDLKPIALLGYVRLFLVCSHSLGLTSDDGLTKLRRQAAIPLTTYGSPGVGTMNHLMLSALLAQWGGKVEHVPYQGTARGLVDLVSGTGPQMFFADAASIGPYLQQKRLIPIAVTGSRRSSLLPDVPAVGEVFPDLPFEAWQALASPLSMPLSVVDQFESAMREAFLSKTFTDHLRLAGLDPTLLVGRDLEELVKTTRSWSRTLIRRAGLEPR